MKYILAAALTVALGGAALAAPDFVPNLNSTAHDLNQENFANRFNAADARTKRFRPSGTFPQQKEAGAMLAAAGVTCDMADAGLVMDAKRGPTATLSYEVACKNDFGWIVTQVNNDVTAYDCLALDTSAKAAPRTRGQTVMSTCRLEANVGSVAGPQALVKKIGAKCTVSEATYLGAGGTPPIGRYEVACKEGAGFVIDKPQPKSQARLLAAACSTDPNSRLPCTLGKKS
jgi:hypothetical protein